MLVLSLGIAAAFAAGAADAENPAQDYVLFCMGCHGEHAQGVAQRVPPLAHMLARFMRTAAGRAYILRVPGVSASALSDAQIASVLNWLAEEFDREDLTTDTPDFTTKEVTALRHAPLPDASSERRRIVADLALSGRAPVSSY
jgi:cytochrome c553